MRALVKAKREPGLWLEDVPVPELGPNDVLIKVKKTGICGTDSTSTTGTSGAQKHDQDADAHRPRVRGRDRRAGQRR